ncbi:MAG: hypothetical protein AAF297_01855 [Planctomycetota bacterium]
MTHLLAGLDIPGELIPLTAIAFGSVIGFFGLIAWHRQRSIRLREREQTARELAAYVAEGSMTTDEAERILHASDVKDD